MSQPSKATTVHDLAALLKDVCGLALTFERGNAYIRTSYIDTQNKLRLRIGDALIAAQSEDATDQIRECGKLLKEAQDLGLTFYSGSAYISAAYIKQQDDLRGRIAQVLTVVERVEQ